MNDVNPIHCTNTFWVPLPPPLAYRTWFNFFNFKAILKAVNLIIYFEIDLNVINLLIDYKINFKTDFKIGQLSKLL